MRPSRKRSRADSSDRVLLVVWWGLIVGACYGGGLAIYYLVRK